MQIEIDSRRGCEERMSLFSENRKRLWHVSTFPVNQLLEGESGRWARTIQGVTVRMEGQIERPATGVASECEAGVVDLARRNVRAGRATSVGRSGGGRAPVYKETLV